jgi:hypothetical protein
MLGSERPMRRSREEARGLLQSHEAVQVGSSGRIRTCDQEIMILLLYR